MKNDTPLSKQLSESINFLRECEKEYQYYLSKVGEQERMRNDLLHLLELDCSDYSDRCKTATRLRNCLKERRLYKDPVEELSPIADFLSKNKNLLDQLGQTLGAVRRAEKYHSCRSYRPRCKSMVAGLDIQPEQLEECV